MTGILVNGAALFAVIQILIRAGIADREIFIVVHDDRIERECRIAELRALPIPPSHPT